jgi:hypothetical protein
MMVLLTTVVVQGQIKIGGNVYGGGNHAEVKGSTKVTVKAGDIGAVMDPDPTARPLKDPQGKVFGGARMANVGGSSFVHIDGENATDFILINQVFGGNDIAGHIGTARAVGDTIPEELTAVKRVTEDINNYTKNTVDGTFNSYVRISSKATNEHYTEGEITAASTNPEDPAYGKRETDVKPDPNAKKIYIGQLFAGGNGDFKYTDDEGNPLKDGNDFVIKQGETIIARSASTFDPPELDKTYLEIKGGSIVYGYGGGNNVTVKQQNIIHIDNPSAVVNHILVDANGNEGDATTYAAYETNKANGTNTLPDGYTDLLTEVRFKEMGINTTFSQPSSGAYQVGRFFGGNNKAEMSIRPTWNLLAGKVRNLYSGGNRGAMTSSNGLLLEIKDYSSLIVDNLYGGCRMADVRPMLNGEITTVDNLPGYFFPTGLSARVLVNGGHINNVYGGNDITGRVYGGNAVGIYTTVYGNVYGGGNGAYPYTDNEGLRSDDSFGDFYYGDNIGSGMESYEALNAFRPNAEQVSIRLKGTEAKPTVIKGSVFVGGNCASLATKKSNPLVELKIGSHVLADKVFLGNNGEGMIYEDYLARYADDDFSSMKLTSSHAFAGYMDGVTMNLQPSIVFDSQANGDRDNYEDYTSKIGSFFCGGNVGSMAIAGKNTYRVNRGLIIFDKFVAGCNNADVAEGPYNAAYQGGILGASDERENYTEGGKIKDRIEVNLENVVIEPRRWDDTFVPITDNDIVNGKLKAGQTYYTTDLRSSQFIADGTEDASTAATDKYYKKTAEGHQLDWNTAKWSLDEDDFMKTGTGGTGVGTDGTGTANDEKRRLLGGNVYGGCYNSGHVNGNVVININQDVIKRDVVFAEANPEDPYEIKSGGDRRSGVLIEAQGDDVQAVAMSVFGAGYGKNTEIWGSTTVNMNNGYAFQVFGGGEEGVVGKKNSTGEYVYNAAYSSAVNLKGENAGYSEKTSGLPLAEAEYIYGGGCEGDVIGNSYVYLGNGRVYDAFGGASNADIYGGTEVHIGYDGGFPWVRDNVYGGNDFGGTIKSDLNHYAVTNREVFEDALKKSSTYVKYIQGRVDSIFGGNYGSYDYADRVFKDYTDDSGKPKTDDEGNPIFSFPRLNNNSFVHFTPADNSNNMVGFIFGGSEGFPGHGKLNNSMQKETYVLIDDTNTKDANRFANVDIYGGGAFAGTGLSEALGAGRTAIDLFAGSFNNVYGGCNQEGLVGYTRVNVPSASTIKLNAIFGGGKGYDPKLFEDENKKDLAARYCDHYVTCVDYQGANAIVNDAIYGGNQNCRVSCDTYINIEAPVMQSNGYQATIYGAGYGKKTISGRTNVFMNNGSNAYKVFGGGRDGNAFNFVSMAEWLKKIYGEAGVPEEEIADKVSEYSGILNDFGTYLDTNPIHLPTNIGTEVNNAGVYDGTHTNDILTNSDFHQTNVHIMNGGNVSGYAYGGGLGTDAVVAGTTYIELKGGNVDKDIYGGGQGGPVFDEFGLGTDVFTCETNVVIEGGMARNVYGGGYQGHVGKHCKTVDGGKIVEAAINESNANDIPAVTNVTIGKVDGNSFYNGIPAIQRNVYGGGEGGSVYGTTNLTINNGYIGYRYKNTGTSGEYVEELDDQKPNSIEKAGNAFGGGYVVNSYVDDANVTMYGGTIRGSLYGGGELGPIGAGTTKTSYSSGTGVENGDVRIFRPGKTSVKMYDGHVMRNVFAGGRGQDSWGGDGTMYMNANTVESLKANGLFCKGYVFGQTEVDIYGGEIGTDDGVALGYGNVFGGGDIGFVYSAYKNESGVLSIGKKNGTRYDDKDNSEGYYYKNENGVFKTSGSEYILTEDCKVLVEPWCKANAAININGTDYAAGDFVPTSDLNYLGNKEDATWNELSKEDFNKEGIIIHNAVFAGGNTSPSSTEVYANTTTVFGNATASINDVYHRDLISIGRGRVGGLYGDGNLTLVDGYREVNITNYGTDYYHINPEITIEEYRQLPNREAAYYEIRYKCLIQCSDKNGKTYAVGSTITADEMINVFDGVVVGEGESAQSMIKPDGKPLESYWAENGVCSRYAGRPMNTVQRSDFCGVFGSRMVMQGARDRVPETVDYTNYTINRVREVSLNKKVSVRAADAGNAKDKEHGNYFGIYSVVNYLGALTSDVDFHTAVRVTDNTDALTYKCATKETDGIDYGTATYYDWKEAFHNERKRNNGNSHNKVALASGVYLELTKETGSGKGLYEKKWGLITGVVELDLINVQPGMGGGYVYAKNAHGIRQSSNKHQTILTALNKGAVTNKQFIYDETEGTKKEWETSGNFVHSTQTIIDDCYNIGAKYLSGYDKPDGVPAHYWFIKGAVYIYDQYISAYTGSPNAFSEEVSIPLTITSASHGKMTLLNVQPNYYAYYSINNKTTQKVLGENDKIELRDKEYGRNDAISYWDYSQLTEAEKALFVDSTYVVIADCTYGNGDTPVTYKAGTVLLSSEYKALKNAAPMKKLDKDDLVETPYVHHVSRDQDVAFDYLFRPSNNVSHNSGFILTYNIDNPNQWNTWYSKADGTEPKNQTGGTGFEDGPTYTPNTTGLYGQNDYTLGSIISKELYDTYQSVKTNHSSVIPSTGQAEFHPAYIVTADLLETTNKKGTEQRFHKGATLSQEDYTEAQWESMSDSIAEAFVVNTTVQLSKTEFMYRNTYLTASEITRLKNTYGDKATEIDKAVSNAYYCTTAGKYGGNYYETGKNYRALAAYTAMAPKDRKNFTFNYDALDLLIDPNYSKDPTTGNVIHADGQKYQYDSAAGTLAGANANLAHYSLQTPIDYTATYNGQNSDQTETEGDNIGKKYMTVSTDLISSGKVYVGDNLDRVVYESLPNEQYHWAPITVSNTDDTYYVVTETIVLGDTPYAAGQVITKDTYDGLGGNDKGKVKSLKFPSTGTYYYCREAYTIPNNADGHAVTSATGVTGGTGGNYDKGAVVATGVVINDLTYNNLTNKQKSFSIHGLAPTETSSLYVTRGSDIFDLSAEKIITVIYQYDYVESDMSGSHITPVSERHVLNIHLNFKSGVPTVEDILEPDIILPGTTISIPEPYVTPGAYEITGGGWKLFDTETDAESHINGMEITPTNDPLYLYQNEYYLAYYAKTYLGETFSNHVPVHVANYHDLKKVMDAKTHHYYIDHKDVHDKQKVKPKIYINDYKTDDPATTQNGLDLFKNLYDLSLLTNESTGVTDGKVTAEGALKDHYLLDKTRVGGGTNLEFFLRTDLSRTDDPAVANEWTPIASGDDPCFNGTLHGDGHTISGLDNSLFGKLCGSVYNLGVTGSFTGAGIVDEGDGYVESCWINTTGTPDGSAYAVFGNPTATGNDTKQIVNSYYQDTKGYKTDASGHGLARPMSDRAFYNGEVAYDLNNFYLYKRFSDKQVTAGEDKTKYRYFIIGDDNKLTLQPAKYYDSHPADCSSGYSGIKYVEDRFEDGDFRFAAGTIPDDEDERYWLETVTDKDGNSYEVDHWSPIWPDDYLFFGQKLTYGYAVQAHQDIPTAVVRDGGRLSQNDDANRVYRAPAYYCSSDMSFIHFNPQAYLAQKSNDGSREVYPELTAIDFAGHNDTHDEATKADKPYELGLNSAGKFYTPLLDDGGLLSIINYDETRNLLVYAPADTAATGYANKATHDVLTNYFSDPAYSDYYNKADIPDKYRTVADATSTNASIYGHLVKSDLIATTDHLLVDKEDFNCPIPYSFDNKHRMWYQRKPEDQEYVNFDKETTTGWQGISIPFTAELVTTDTKGEITHFYGGSRSIEGSEAKIGHEYWLRELTDITEETVNESKVAKASFTYPAALGDTKTVTNTFLWDYYYENTAVHKHKDYNKDTYQTYYNDKRTYTSYPLLAGATPYIIGLPGKDYYEFDLSGNFEAQNTAVTVDKLSRQTITFASNTGVGIGVSDEETKNGVQKSLEGTDNNYSLTFKPSYMNMNLEAGTYSYTLDAAGDSYDKVPATGSATKVSAFRPYFAATVTAKTTPSPKMMPESILFGDGYSGLEDEPKSAFDGDLEIYVQGHKIIAKSHLTEATTVRIINVSGVTVANYVIQPGETIETPVNIEGVYIANKKKLLVK